MEKIRMTVEQLESLLNQQKKVTADYITRNLTTYTFFNQHSDIDINIAKKELSSEAMKSGYPEEFNILSKYLKP